MRLWGVSLPDGDCLAAEEGVLLRWRAGVAACVCRSGLGALSGGKRGHGDPPGDHGVRGWVAFSAFAFGLGEESVCASGRSGGGVLRQVSGAWACAVSGGDSADGRSCLRVYGAVYRQRAGALVRKADAGVGQSPAPAGSAGVASARVVELPSTRLLLGPCGGGLLGAAPLSEGAVRTCTQA